MLRRVSLLSDSQLSSEKPVRILVLGGTGFIGSAFVERAAAAGHVVSVLSRHPRDGQDKVRSAAAIEYVVGDLSDVEILGQVTAGVDICLHAASTTVPSSSNRFMEQDVTENLIGSIRVLQSCVRSNVTRVIFVSSGGTVYGRPVNLPILESDPTNPIGAYGIVKLAIEKYCVLFGELYGLDYRIARFSNPYGPKQNTASGQGVVAAFVEKALKGETLLVMGDGTIVRDFVYIDDAVDALLKLCSYAGPHQIFNVGSGLGTSINAIISSIAAASQPMPKVEYRESRKFDVPANILSCDLARRELGWSPTTSLEAGLKATIDAKRVELERNTANVAARPSDR
jgi:UDP-glucose 4-epimerase